MSERQATAVRRGKDEELFPELGQKAGAATTPRDESGVRPRGHDVPTALLLRAPSQPSLPPPRRPLPPQPSLPPRLLQQPPPQPSLSAPATVRSAEQPSARISRPALPPPSLPPRSSSRAPLSVPPVAYSTAPVIRERRRQGVWFASLGALVAVLGSAAFLLAPSGRGVLTVTVAGPNNEPIPHVQILADEASRCTSSPCKLDALAAGTHFVRVNAVGYQPTAPRAVTVSSDGEATVHVQLSKVAANETKQAAQPTAEGALKVDELPTAASEATAPSRSAGQTESAARAPQLAAKLLAASGVAADARATDDARRGAASTSESGVLNINSTPVANVVLDGRPIGQTPLLGVEVTAGTHTVVFIDPAGGGRAVRSATVEGGTTGNVTARLGDSSK